MDPVSMAALAVALFSQRAGEAVAEEAADGALAAVRAFLNRLRRKLPSATQQSVDRLGAGAELKDDRAEVGLAVQDVLARDEPSAAEFTRLLAALSSTSQGRELIASANDNAKQVNIAGDNSGPISFT